MSRLRVRSLIQRLRAATAMASAFCLFVTQSTMHAFALPQGGQVAGGQASITSGGGQMTIGQSSQSALINWQSFNIGGGESVSFNQPSSTAIALNRIHDINSSQIDGALIANGRVWLVNANGIVFGNSAQVHVGGLLATTSDIDDERFLNGDYTFDTAGNLSAIISNAGSIRIADGGLAALVGPNVSNSGLIEARLGTVHLASGDAFAFDLYGDGLIHLQASPALASQLVSNSGTILADGGRVRLTAAAARETVGSLINMHGIIRVNSVGEQGGEITLYAEGSNAVAGNDGAMKGQKAGASTVLVSGTIEAKGESAGEKGGTIEVLGDHVGLLSGSAIDASGAAGGGAVRVGGDYLGGGATPAASAVIVQGGAQILADATLSGDGGRVTVWADDWTDFGGRITARAGAFGGDGGFIETSGRNVLNAYGVADASSACGQAGVWLLDPNNITINTTSNANVSSSGRNPLTWTTTANSGVLTVASLSSSEVR
jgi:filamentous hemagglutinin family protein